MNTLTCLGVCILGFLALPSTAQYLVDPVTGRAFNLFNLFSADKTSLATRVTSLETLLANRLPKCPTSAPIGSVVLGGTCFSVTMAPATWVNAELACEAGGGTLALPIPAFSGPLLTALQAAFPAIGTTRLWIGASIAAGAPVTAVIYVTGTLVLNPIFAPAAAVVAGNIQGALLGNPNGSPWTLDINPTPHSFVCQYQTI